MNKPKFRAWKKIRIQEMFNDVVRIDWLNNKIAIKYPNPGGNTFRIDEESLDNVILMQYIGLKDNSEEPLEIWQKSIVKIVNNEGDYFIGVVEYFGDQGYPAFDIDCKYYKDWHFDSNVLSEALGNDNLKIYVIGDEYSNPELLNEVE